jgi:hypothetical protein
MLHIFILCYFVFYDRSIALALLRVLPLKMAVIAETRSKVNCIFLYEFRPKMRFITERTLALVYKLDNYETLSKFAYYNTSSVTVSEYISRHSISRYQRIQGCVICSYLLIGTVNRLN